MNTRPRIYVSALLSVALSACHETPRNEPDGNGGRDAAVSVDVPEPPAPDANVATPITSMPGHGNLAQDTTPKRGPRVLPVEAYVRSYMQLFGGLAPLAIQTQIRARDATLFDTWNDYLASLGLPDHRVDINRVTQTSPIMLASLERTGIALCDLAVARELDATSLPPLANRTVFAFDVPAGTLDRTAFASRFNTLHTTFLGYPSRLAPDNREQRFFDLYTQTVTRYTAAGAPATLFRVKSNTGWAAVCYALVRHPEFQLY